MRDNHSSFYQVCFLQISIRVCRSNAKHVGEHWIDVYILKSDMLNNARDNMKILHPLPRVNEISYDVDENPHAYYIQQAQNGLYAREAIICDVLGIGYDQVAGDTTIIK